MENYDVVVIGGGHAGIEAALASGKMGCKTIMFTLNLDTIGLMPCNPNIGGSSKGHLVKEIDALGGEMGKATDKTFIQSRLLNTGKGPAVYSLRVQVDKPQYMLQMKNTMENAPNVEVRQGEIVKINVENNTVVSVVTEAGTVYNTKNVVIATGTYLKSRCLYGETIIESGPNGLKNSIGLEQCLKDLGITMYRFKTGTPARVDRRTIDLTKMEPQNGDDIITPFSFETKSLQREQVPCYLTYTNATTHKIIQDNIHKSPMYSGVIEGTGTRYCPSIEDKIVRFADKPRHQVFVEPEGLSTNEMYIQGMSTSLPEDVQLAMYRSIEGMENCKFMRNGYAIEYSCIDATQLNLTLEFKNIKGLFSAGQFNGSSGYEEAAAQGLIAGINASLSSLGKDMIILTRADGYIGVLIDDLVTKGTKEPYRMMTSRAEYRLLLRQDNADSRLTKIGYKVGLISQQRYDNLLWKEETIKKEIERVKSVIVKPNEITNTILEKYNSTPLNTGMKLNELIKRPELSLEKLVPLDPDFDKDMDPQVLEQVNIQIKYEGYIKRQIQQVEQFKKLEAKLLPQDDFDYDIVDNLRIEARQKLNKIKPLNIGHASRISGVSPADISSLLIFLEKTKTKNI